MKNIRYMLSRKWKKKELTSQTNFPNCYISEEMEALQHKTKYLQLED